MIWLNGVFLPVGRARIDPMDRGFTLGDGLFETIRVSGGTIRWLDRHLARLAAGAEILDLPMPYGADEIAAVIGILVRDKGPPSDAAIRLTLTRGAGARGIMPPDPPTPTCTITAGPLVLSDRPARAIIATRTRRNEWSVSSRIKSIACLESIIARQEAASRGADEALLLNSQGYVAEASVGSVFFMLGDTLVTPPVEDGALPGIARGLLLERAGAVERRLKPIDLFEARGGFISNALGLRSIECLNGITIRRADFDLDGFLATVRGMLD